MLLVCYYLNHNDVVVQLVLIPFFCSVVTSTPNESLTDSVEGLGGESPDKDWLVGLHAHVFII